MRIKKSPKNYLKLRQRQKRISIQERKNTTLTFKAITQQ
jgi:hypothetical protein